MALVEIEAGPHRITAAITRDAVEELGPAAGVPGDRRGQGDERDGAARRSGAGVKRIMHVGRRGLTSTEKRPSKAISPRA